MKTAMEKKEIGLMRQIGYLSFVVVLLFGLTGLSALFSFMVFMDKNMWAGSPDLTLSVITEFFTATVIFYMFYVLIYYFDRMGAGE